MHYKNNRQANVGDRVVVLSNSREPLAGILLDINAGSSPFNGRVIVDPVAIQNAAYVTLSDCLHADDLVATPANVVPDMSKSS